jgi:hypothetical protein
MAHHTIATLASALNEAAANFEIGGLQDLRSRLRGKARASRWLFDHRTIFPTYAFHVGGRKELQFNIGSETIDGSPAIRFCLAFSLETSRSFPTIEPLRPKIARFNEYVRDRSEDLLGLSMWWHNKEGRSADRPVHPVDDTLVAPRTFIAVGQWVRPDEVDVRVVLSTFDQLLPLYRYAESDQPLAPPVTARPFRPGCPAFILSTTRNSQTGTLEVALRHKEIQRELFRLLSKEFGRNNVEIEHKPDIGVYVDAVVQRPKGLTFYEVKVSQSVQGAVRQAIGQLLEYAYWPSAERAQELVIVGEGAPGESDAAYMRLLRRRFRLPVWYRQIDLGRRRLGVRI